MPHRRPTALGLKQYRKRLTLCHSRRKILLCHTVRKRDQRLAPCGLFRIRNGARIGGGRCALSR